MAAVVMGWEVRLRRVEIQLAGIDNQLKHVATKAWVLGGVVAAVFAGMGIATSVAVAIVMMYLRAP